MRYPIKDKFWGWRMDPFEVFAHWDSWRTSPNMTLTLTLMTFSHVLHSVRRSAPGFINKETLLFMAVIYLCDLRFIPL